MTSVIAGDGPHQRFGLLQIHLGDRRACLRHQRLRARLIEADAPQSGKRQVRPRPGHAARMATPQGQGRLRTADRIDQFCL
mgnify:CR=1 FL=1